jgi:hypothetical protein
VSQYAFFKRTTLGRINMEYELARKKNASDEKLELCGCTSTVNTTPGVATH